MILNFHKIEDTKVWYSVQDTKGLPVEITLIDKLSNTVIWTLKNKIFDESFRYFLSVPVSCLPKLGRTILKSTHVDGVIEIEIDFGNYYTPLMVCEKHFQSFYSNRASFYTFKEVFYDKIYDGKIVKIEKDDVVVDIGANFGFFTIFAQNEGAKKTIALEPDFENFITLLENTKTFENITCYNLAISNKVGLETFCYSNITSAGSHLKKFNNILGEKQNIEMNVITIDIEKLFDLFNLDEINYLKLDCEGAELDIFENITKETLKKIKKISLEFHSSKIRDKIKNILLSNNFVIESEFFLQNSDEIGMILAYNI